MGPLRVHSHGRRIARSADLRPHITATPAWPRRRKRRGALGHWPLEPVTQASAGRSLLVAPWAASMPPESVPQGSRCMCFEHARRSLPSCAPTEPHPDILTCREPVQAVSDALPFYDFLAYLFAPSHMYNPFSSARRSDAWGALVSPSRAASFSSSGMRPAVEDPEAKPPRRRARGRSESRNCGLHSALPGADLPPRDDLARPGFHCGTSSCNLFSDNDSIIRFSLYITALLFICHEFE